MPEASATKIVALLRGHALRNRSGILLLPALWIGRESEIAGRLGISYRDLRQQLLRQLRPDQRYLGISWQDIVNRDITGLPGRPRPDGDCELIGNSDLLISALKSEERSHFWQFMRQNYRPPWGLLMALPSETKRLLPTEELSVWQASGRIAAWEGGIE